jgi:hypothetical protein
MYFQIVSSLFFFFSSISLHQLLFYSISFPNSPKFFSFMDGKIKEMGVGWYEDGRRPLWRQLLDKYPQRRPWKKPTLFTQHLSVIYLGHFLSSQLLENWKNKENQAKNNRIIIAYSLWGAGSYYTYTIQEEYHVYREKNSWRVIINVCCHNFDQFLISSFRFSFFFVVRLFVLFLFSENFVAGSIDVVFFFDPRDISLSFLN